MSVIPNPALPWRRALAVAAVLLLATSAAFAGTVTLSTTPPGVTSRVAPNIVVTFDDSGSMNSTAIPDSLDDYPDKKYYYSATGNPIYFDPTVTYVVPPDANGDPLGASSYGGAWRDGYCANTLAGTCWTPGVGYQSPNIVKLDQAFYSGFLANIQAGNSPCSRNANGFNTWKTDGCASKDIPQAVRTTVSTGTCSGTACGSGTTTDSSGNTTRYSSCSGNGNSRKCTTTTTTYDAGGFYYVCPTAGSETGCVYHLLKNESDDTKQNFANWYSYYRTRNLTARAAVGRVFGSISDGAVRVAWQTLQAQDGSGSGAYNTTSAFKGVPYGPITASSEIRDLANSTTGCSVDSTSQTNCWRSMFMNWVYGAPASGGTPTRLATQGAGQFFSRSLVSANPARDPYWNGSQSAPGELSCRKNFHMVVTDGYWNNDTLKTANTPDGTKSVTLPDGTSYSSSAVQSKIFWNADHSNNVTSLADIAFAYWANDLRADLKNNVPAYYPDLTTGITGTKTTVNAASPGSNTEVYFNPANDPATWQHMSEYMVTMGVAGTRTSPDDLLALRTGSKNWPAPLVAGGATNIDDTWHAAINSRGGYFSAADPNSLVSSLSNILSSVIASSSTSLTLSLSTNVLTSNAVAYYAGYDTTNWSGLLLAKPVATDGTVGTQLWSAGDLLTARSLSAAPRLIVTSTGAGTGLGVAFAYANLSTTEKAALDSSDGTGAASTTDALGSNRVDWLSGVRTLEGTTFRTRTSLLGAVFGSQPAFVGAPTGGYSDTFPAGSPEAAAISTDSYSSFVTKWASRAATVYVGANDGMLHAFDATLAGAGGTPGKERWAYVPASVYGSLPAQSKLTKYAFAPTVDGSPVTSDVFFNGTNADNKSVAGWHTLLVGSLRLGGRGVFAMDITDPSATAMGTTTTVASKVLWEFNSTMAASATGTPANLGYTFGTPVVVRIALTNTDSAKTNGRWVVMVPGGYFPDNSTDAAASNTFSSLFVLDAQSGALLKEIRTPAGTTSHGLTTPTLGDYDSDQVADVAFAGDMDGNVWRIDLKAAAASSNPTDGVSLLFKPATANAQSITTSPRLVADPTSKFFIVVFGTGRFLSTADTADTTVQAVYGIRDPGVAVTSPVTVAGGSLVRQVMTLDSTSQAIGVTSSAVPATAAGWYMLLNTASGERVVVTPALDSSNSVVTFSTLIPTSSDPCTTSSSGSVFALDGTTGAAAFGVSVGSAVSFSTGATLAGARVTGSASSGWLYMASNLSGGNSYAVGQLTGSGPFTDTIPVARRRSWHVLNSEN